MSKRPAHERDEQILDLLDGSLPEAKQAELRAWLDQSPAHWGRFAELSFIHSQIASQLHSQRSSTDLRLDALQAVAPQDELPPIHLDATALTKDKYISALTYVLKHTFTPKRIAILASAATVLLGVVLTIVLMSGPADSDSPPIVESPQQPTHARETLKAVATITAERDAVWDRRPGQDLYAGQRFTLTHGIAEITTKRGAIAILQAPATIELTDNNNALHLHAGKLVGICETESSKGFVVRTPQMQVIDLGTWFGVDVMPGGLSELHVLTGRVAARPVGQAASDSVEQTIVAGQSARIDTGSDRIQIGTAEPMTFAFGLPPEMLEPTRIADDFEQINPSVQGQLAEGGGEGWSSPWTNKTHMGMTLSLANTSANPLSPGSNRYLEAIFRNADRPGMASVARSFDRYGKVDRTKPHIIRFQIRAGEPINAEPAFAYRLSVHDATTDRPGTSAADTWMLAVFSKPDEAEQDASSIGKNNVSAMSWSFYDPRIDNTRDQFDLSQLKDTGVPLIPGQTYEVQIRVNPQASAWDFTIVGESGRYDSRESLGRSIRFRSGADQAGGYLHFNLRHNQPEAENRLQIDSVQIEVLPDSISRISFPVVIPNWKRFLIA